MVKMETAYSLKGLVAHVKAEAAKKGLTIAEEAAEEMGRAIYFGTKNWAKESAEMTETKADDVLVGFTDYADPYVLPQIEKLDLNGDGK